MDCKKRQLLTAFFISFHGHKIILCYNIKKMLEQRDAGLLLPAIADEHAGGIYYASEIRRGI